MSLLKGREQSSPNTRLYTVCLLGNLAYRPVLTLPLSDLVFFHGLGNHILVLNPMKAIDDLLEKR